MAKTNKYTSINFNDIYDKKASSSPATTTGKQPPFPSSAAHKSCYLSAASRSHGMLVLSRPSPKPIAQPPPPSIRDPMTPQSLPDRDSISLRPLGKTGPGFEAAGKKDSVPISATPTPKSDKFVPPHLRPGFVAKDDRSPHLRPGSSGGVGIGEDRRPKSGGYGSRRGYMESYDVNRPRSGGSRPNSSG